MNELLYPSNTKQPHTVKITETPNFKKRRTNWIVLYLFTDPY